MSLFDRTISNSSQRLSERVDYGAEIISSHKPANQLSEMHVGISAICLPIFNEQHKSYASDRGMT